MSSTTGRSLPGCAVPLFFLALVGAVVVVMVRYGGGSGTPPPVVADPPAKAKPQPRPRQDEVDDSGYTLAIQLLRPLSNGGSLEEVRDIFRDAGRKNLPRFDGILARPGILADVQLVALIGKATMLLYEGDADPAYDVLGDARRVAEAAPDLAHNWLSTVIFLQGTAALRRGETDNCVLCRGESSCIVPINRAAVHQYPKGSRDAVRHFTEYLERHPDDLGVKWLLAVAAMTLGEYPQGVPEAYRLPGDPFRSEVDVGRFRDIGHRVGINRFNQAGGCILDDFDNDGRLDLVTTSWDTAMRMAFYRNKGDGTFEEVGEKAGLGNQLGGLYGVQTDYNNDGFLDVLVVRGAWWTTPIRPSLLKNNGNGTFTDVTAAAGLMTPVNAISAQWADYDNDGHLDLFLGTEHTRHLLYHNKGNGTFEEVAGKAGVAGTGETCKGIAWGDFDADGFPDLFLNCIDGPRLFRNSGTGTFRDVTAAMGITGPRIGFSCWFFDYDNDGWPDLLAHSYVLSIDDCVRGLLNLPTEKETGRVYRNLGGKGFQDVTKEVGFDKVLAPMGTNFADLDNDGYLDFYVGTGWPRYSALVPNRMFKNVGGQRFADVSMSSGTAHLQKGHAVACGDWDRDGNVDVFIEMGGATPGDRYHNILFQNPGNANHWLNVKLVGVKSNRAAIGARIKAVTAGPEPLTVYRHVGSGSSFGANPLEQTLGIGAATKVARLEVYWPTSGTTQVFTDIAADQSLEITESAAAPRVLNHKRIPLPPEVPK